MATGCQCAPSPCDIATCPCLQANATDRFIFDGRCFFPIHTDRSNLNLDAITLYLCNKDACACACQPGRCLHLAPTPFTTVAPTPNKGLGAFSTTDPIPPHTLIAEYTGEYITKAEATKRLDMYDAQESDSKQQQALLVVREVLPSGTAALRTYIDATKTTGVHRYVNHSCDGGNITLVIARSPPTLLVPRVLMFTNRAVAPGEELTFSYGPPPSSLTQQQQEKKACFCGTRQCSGYLPQEDV